MSKPGLVVERKNQIIVATIECIACYGYSNFSMQDVAKIADVSKGIIHYYFLNKEELLMAVLDTVAGDIESLLNDVLSKIVDSVERMRIFIRTCFNIVRTHRSYYCINMDFWAQINQKEKVRKLIADHYANFRMTATNIIQQGINRGVFKNTNASILASMVISMFDGISLQWLFDEKVFDYDQIILESEKSILSWLKV